MGEKVPPLKNMSMSSPDLQWVLVQRCWVGTVHLGGQHSPWGWGPGLGLTHRTADAHTAFRTPRHHKEDHLENWHARLPCYINLSYIFSMKVMFHNVDRLFFINSRNSETTFDIRAMPEKTWWTLNLPWCSTSLLEGCTEHTYSTRLDYTDTISTS